jgi:O-antigen/teichoic acid export membrane protein
MIPLGIVRLQANYYRRSNKLVRFAFLNYCSINTAAVILMYCLGFFLKNPSLITISYVLAIFVAVLLGSDPAFFSRRKRIPDSNKNFDKKKVLKYSFPLMVYQLIENGYEWIVILLAGLFLQNEKVGIIAIIIKLSSLFSFVDTGVNSAVLSKMAEHHSFGRIVELKSLYKSSVKLIVACNFILIIFGIAGASYLFSYLGSEFNNIIVPLILVFIARLFESFVAPLQSLLPVLRLQEDLMKIFIFRLSILLLLLLIFIPMWGILGIGMAIFSTASIYFSASLLYIRYRIKILS